MAWLSRGMGLIGVGLIAFFLLFAWGEVQWARNARSEADAIAALRALIIAEGLYAKDHGGAVASPDCLRKPATCAPPPASDKPYLDANWPGSSVEGYWTARFHPGSASAEGRVERYAVTLVRKAAKADRYGRNSFCGDSEGLMIAGSDSSEPGLRDGVCDQAHILMRRAEERLPRDRAQAIVFFGKAADQGNADAQTILGGIYLDGEGAPPDYAQALAWFRKAAAQAQPAAQFNLGGMYDKGQGVPPDQTQAVDWFRKAAEQGDPGAQYKLALKYDKGQGVPVDRMQALVWANIALDGADYEYRKKSAELRQEIVATMTPQRIAQAQVLAFKWQEAGRRADRAPGRRDFIVDRVPPPK